jgi:hypothetical protein
LYNPPPPLVAAFSRETMFAFMVVPITVMVPDPFLIRHLDYLRIIAVPVIGSIFLNQ